MPEGEHPLPDLDDTETCDACGREVIRGILPQKGWTGLEMVELDGRAWPLDFAAKHLGVSEDYLRVTIKEIGLEPEGTIRTASFRRSGRQPRAYRARALVMIAEKATELREELGPQDPTA